MKTKNYAALLAILAISAFLHADCNNTLAVPDYSTHQITLFKQLIKKYPSLLQNNTIKSWVAYLEYTQEKTKKIKH